MIPWYLKIPAKMVLSRTAIPRTTLNRLGIFRHGCMTRTDYVQSLVRGHLERSGVDPAGKVVLELGPGDSIGSGIVAWALGAEKSILVDAGDWATREISFYRQLVEMLSTALPASPRLARAGTKWSTFDEMLEAFSITYLTNGLGSLRGIADSSCDFCFSEAVLEHVRVDDFQETIHALRRVLKPGSVTSHLIDYKDHLQSGLNNMRFSKRLWESRLFSDSGFYTNRLRHDDIMKAFDAAGFGLVLEDCTHWNQIPISRRALHPEFRHYSRESLGIKEAVVVFRVPEAIDGNSSGN